MLEQILSKFQGAVVVFLILLLSAVFVVQFGGPQAEGCTGSGSVYAAKVGDVNISEGDFRAAYALAGFDRRPPEQQKAMNLKEHVLNGLIERSLLADESRKMGFEVTEDDVMAHLATKNTIRMSLGVDAPSYLLPPGGQIPVGVNDDDGNFDSEAAKQLIQFRLRRSIKEFADAQIEETLADRAREVLLSSVQVSNDEVWDSYKRETDSARVKFIRFSPDYYGNQLKVTKEGIDAFMATKDKEITTEYEANKHRYTGLDEQVRARHILIKSAATSTDEEKAAARAKTEGILARIKAGESFAALAKEFSEDPGSGKQGGDLGYNPRGKMVGPFDEAQFSLEVDEVSDLIETQFGFHIIKTVGKRKGDVPVDEAKREIAERMYKEFEAGARAEKAAKNALANLKNGWSLDRLDAKLAGKEWPIVAPVEGEDGEEPAEEKPRDALAPQVRESRDFGRGDNPIPGPFDSSDMVRQAFDLTKESPLPKGVVKMGKEFVVFKLVERAEAKKEDLTGEISDRITQGLLLSKKREVLTEYVTDLRKKALSKQKVRVNEAVLSYGDDPAS